MSLEDKLAQLKKQEEDKAKWEREKPGIIAEWKADVKGLISTVEGYLSDLKSRVLVTTQVLPLDMDEHNLGRYQTSELRIKAGDRTVALRPVGRMIMGFPGRVDLIREGAHGKNFSVSIMRLKSNDADQGATMRKCNAPPERPQGPAAAGALRSQGGRPTSGRPMVVARRPELVDFDKEAFERHLEALIS